MSSVSHPKWQYPLRQAQFLLGRKVWEEETPESQQARSEGSQLYRVLKTFFGLPIAKGTILSNYHTADGFWFQLKLHPNDVAADGHPLHSSTNAIAGHHKSPTKATITFTLYVGHVTPDESYPNWPQPRALVVRELGLVNTNYTGIQAALATLIDAVEIEYQRALPHYQAWVAMQNMPSDAQAQTDYLRQLIRQALRRMPASEILSIPEPVAIPEADAADEAANVDGMVKPVEPTVTLTDLQEKADGIIEILDEMLAAHGLPPDEFDGYDEFDPDDEDDDLDDDFDEDETERRLDGILGDDEDEDDTTDPDTSDCDEVEDKVIV